MKKVFLMAFALLTFLLCACTPTGTTSKENSDTSTDTSVEQEQVYETVLVSKGKPYTVSCEATEVYPDIFGQQLTDGEKVPDLGAHYVDVRMVGYNKPASIVIDLGEDGKGITKLVARSLDMYQDGVLAASVARFYGSNDGEKWSTLGIRNFEQKSDLSVTSAVLEMKEPKDYQYIKVAMYVREGAHFFFTDEVEVYGTLPKKEVTSSIDEAYKNASLDTTAWKTLSTGKKAIYNAKENYAERLKYSMKNMTFDDRAPSNTVFLTDGDRTRRLFGENVWIGINAKEDSYFQVKLNKTVDNLFSFSLHALGGGKNVSLPDYVDFYASEDGDNYTFLGRIYAPDEASNHEYRLVLPEFIKARYIRMAIPEGGPYWFEEMEVLGGVEAASQGELFDMPELPQVTEPEYWSNSDADYNKTIDLILGRPQQIASSHYLDLAEHEDETPETTTVLTDGKRSSDTYCYNGEYFFSRGGGALEFFYDMTKTSSVEKITISYLEHKEWGISAPTHIKAYLSDDGTNWYAIYAWDQPSDYVSSHSAKRSQRTFTLDTPIAARFVRIRIESAFLFVDEIEVWGKKNVEGAKTLKETGIHSTIYYTTSESAEYADVDNTRITAKNIDLVVANQQTKNSLLPRVAYLDKNGNIVDTFMDGFLYCTNASLPSGSLPHLDNYKVDWEFVFDQTFNSNGGLDSLDETVKTVKDALNRPDHKVQVYFTFLTIRDGVTDFGDVDGDGISESLATAEGREKVIKWFVNKCVHEFNSREYQNLEIGGFYWVNESVTWEKDDSAIIKETIDIVHSLDYPIFWIPYFCAHRYYEGYDMGFDLVSMQPNYVFKSNEPEYRVPTTSIRTKYQGMTVEIEHTYQALSDPNFAESYMKYLLYGAKDGYMKDGVHIYYHDVENFSLMGTSTDPLCRLQYDATYNFAKGTLEVTPEKKDTIKLTARTDEVLRADIGDSTLPTRFELVKAPENGTVTLTKEGKVLYFPNKGYKGTDSFEYTYNNYLDTSEPCKVEITVE